MTRSCYTHEWVTLHIWLSRVTHMNESWPSTNAAREERLKAWHVTREKWQHTHECLISHWSCWDLSCIWMNQGKLIMPWERKSERPRIWRMSKASASCPGILSYKCINDFNLSLRVKLTANIFNMMPAYACGVMLMYWYMYMHTRIPMVPSVKYQNAPPPPCSKRKPLSFNVHAQ